MKGRQWDGHGHGRGWAPGRRIPSGRRRPFFYPFFNPFFFLFPLKEGIPFHGTLFREGDTKAKRGCMGWMLGGQGIGCGARGAGEARVSAHRQYVHMEHGHFDGQRLQPLQRGAGQGAGEVEGVEEVEEVEGYGCGSAAAERPGAVVQTDQLQVLRTAGRKG
jgi:hypothetical protein